MYAPSVDFCVLGDNFLVFLGLAGAAIKIVRFVLIIEVICVGKHAHLQ